MYVCVCVYVCMYAYMFVCMYVWMYVCVRVCMYVLVQKKQNKYTSKFVLRQMPTAINIIIKTHTKQIDLIHQTNRYVLSDPIIVIIY